MEEMNIDLNDLIQNWKDLHAELKKNKKIKFEVFEKAFAQTYALLSKQSAQNQLDKQFVEMVVNAFLFASTESKDLEFRYHAALVLTERMLNLCAFNTTSVPVDSAVVYIFELRKEVRIEFNDVNESINKLTKLFEEDFWKKL